jgi:hypothetical protein
MDAVIWDEVVARTGEESRFSISFQAFLTVACLLAAIGAGRDRNCVGPVRCARTAGRRLHRYRRRGRGAGRVAQVGAASAGISPTFWGLSSNMVSPLRADDASPAFPVERQ